MIGIETRDLRGAGDAPFRFERLCVLMMFASAALLLAAAAAKPLWNNEFITLKTLRLPWREIYFERIRMNHMPGYFLALKGLTDLFGINSFSLRLLSLLGGLGAVAAYWRFGRWVWGARAGLLAGGLALLSQYLLDQSSQARMYSLLHCAIALSMFLYVRILCGAPKRVWAAHFAIGVAAVWCHLLFGMAAVVQVVHATVLRRRIEPPVWKVWALLAAPFLASAPALYLWLVEQQFVGHDVFEIPSLGQWLRHLLASLWGEWQGSAVLHDWFRALGVGAMIASLAVLAATVKRVARASGEGGAVPASASEVTILLLPWWFLLPAAVIYLGAFRTRDALNTLRYYAPAAAAAPLIVTAAWISIPSRRWRRLYGALCLGVCAACAASFILWPGSGLRQATRLIADRFTADDGIVVCDRGAAGTAFAYYGHNGIRPVELNKRERDQAAVRAVVDRAAAGHKRLWVLLYHGGKTPLLKTLEESQGAYIRTGDSVKIGESRVLLYGVRRESGE